ncbi:MAG TPA: beta-ketoacyl-ACP synthase [Oleiagrimonas sp.]|nr:beta-ketoacyl-ACP synthase [Oleiagrimonas sp.]
MLPIAISAATATSAVGRGRDAHAQAFAAMRGALRVNDASHAPLACRIGRVDGIEGVALPEAHARWDCRNNRLAWLGLEQDGFRPSALAAIERYGPTRVAVLMGTSTGSIGATEQAYRRLDDGRLPADVRDRRLHTLHSLGHFTADVLGAQGPCLTISTACSSSAKVFATGARLIQSGLVDAAVVGGVDSLCDSVLFGFNSLELVSPEACRPFDVARQGISIGEAAGFALLERVEAAPQAPRLAGYGESSDAWHMSTPHPEAVGAEHAVRDALARADVSADAVDYIHLHGTATRKNDEVEAAMVKRLFPATTRASSIKGYIGHTLGAAGALGAMTALLAIERGQIPGNLGCSDPDPACGPQLQLESVHAPVGMALVNAFGFGGNNACLAFARAEAAA